MPRRDGVILLAVGEPAVLDLGGGDSRWRATYLRSAAPGGRARPPPLRMPRAPGAEIAGLGDRRDVGARRSRGFGLRGGVGSHCVEALLVDLDPWGGGIDLLLGGESAPGLRWPDLSLQGGRLTWSAVRDALPHAPRRERAVGYAAQLTRLTPARLRPILEAGRRGGATVICDVPRRMSRDRDRCAGLRRLGAWQSRPAMCAALPPQRHWPPCCAPSIPMSVWWCVGRRRAGCVPPRLPKSRSCHCWRRCARADAGRATGAWRFAAAPALSARCGCPPGAWSSADQSGVVAA